MIFGKSPNFSTQNMCSPSNWGFEEIKQVSINRQLFKGIPIKSQRCPGLMHARADALPTFNLKTVLCISQSQSSYIFEPNLTSCPSNLHPLEKILQVTFSFILFNAVHFFLDNGEYIFECTAVN